MGFLLHKQLNKKNNRLRFLQLFLENTGKNYPMPSFFPPQHRILAIILSANRSGHSTETAHLEVINDLLLLLLLLSTPLHQRAASRVQHPNHVAANSLSPQVARKGSTLSGFVQRSRLEREVGRDLHSNKWEEV